MPPDPKFPAPDPRDVDPRAVRRAFARAAATYDDAAALQREVATRMAARLDYVKVAPALVLDAGCGTGEAVGELAVRYPDARVVALDVALPMVASARERARRSRSLLGRLLPRAFAADARAPWFVCADVNALPLPGVAFDVAWSNLALQWVNDLPRAFAEFRRVLKVGGLLTFTTFGPDTLKEIRRAFARVDGHTHTNRFVDMHDVGDMLVHAGFADPVMDQELVTLRGTPLPLVYLQRVFHLPKAPPVARQPAYGLLTGTGEGRSALVVDRIIGIRESVVRPISDPLISPPGITGATELGDGSLALVLDVPGVLRASRNGKAGRS